MCMRKFDILWHSLTSSGRAYAGDFRRNDKFCIFGLWPHHRCAMTFWPIRSVNELSLTFKIECRYPKAELEKLIRSKVIMLTDKPIARSSFSSLCSLIKPSEYHQDGNKDLHVKHGKSSHHLCVTKVVVVGCKEGVQCKREKRLKLFRQQHPPPANLALFVHAPSTF